MLSLISHQVQPTTLIIAVAVVGTTVLLRFALPKLKFTRAQQVAKKQVEDITAADQSWQPLSIVDILFGPLLKQNLAVTAKWEIKKGAQLNQNVLCDALRCVVAKHPRLRMQIKPDLHSPTGWAISHKRSDIPVHAPLTIMEQDASNHNSLRTEILRQFSVGISESSPWRLAVISQDSHAYVIFFASHALSDGVGCNIFHGDLLCYYSKLATLSTQERLEFVGGIKSLPLLQDVSKLAQSPPWYMRMIIPFFVKAAFQKRMNQTIFQAPLRNDSCESSHENLGSGEPTHLPQSDGQRNSPQRHHHWLHSRRIGEDSQILGEQFATYISSPPSQEAGPAVRRCAETGDQLHPEFITIPQPQVQKLRQVAKEHGISVGSLLNTLVLCEKVRFQRETLSKEPRNYQLQMPADFRRHFGRFQGGKGHIQNAAAPAVLKASLTDGSKFWDVAKQMHQQVEGAIKESFMWHRTFPLVAKALSQAAQDNNGILGDVSISNLGLHQGVLETSVAQMTELWTQVDTRCLASLSVNWFNTLPQGQMCISKLSRADYVPQAELARMAAWWRYWIDKIATADVDVSIHAVSQSHTAGLN